MSNLNAVISRYLDRLNAVEEARQACLDDTAQILAEAKSEGLDPKILRKLAAARRKDGEVDTLRQVVNLSDNLDLLGDDDA